MSEIFSSENFDPRVSVQTINGGVRVVFTERLFSSVTSVVDTRRYLRGDREGGRFLIEALQEIPSLSDVFSQLRALGIQYYSNLLHCAETDGALSSDLIDREISNLLNFNPGVILQTESEGVTYGVIELLIAYSLYEGRKQLLEKICCIPDEEKFIQSHSRFLDVLHQEASFVDNHIHASSAFFNAQLLSWRLKMSCACEYDHSIARAGERISREFSYYWGELADGVGLFRDQLRLVNFLSPGGGSGKTSVIQILAHMDRHNDRVPIVLKLPKEGLASLREEAWSRVAELENRLQGIQDADEIERLEKALARNFQTYMEGRFFPIDIVRDRLLQIFDIVYPHSRLCLQPYVETMGLPCFCSAVARMFGNNILFEERTLLDSLRNDPDVRLNRDTLQMVVYPIINILRRSLENGLIRTGRPVIYLDMPVQVAVNRSRHSKVEKRNRHNEDRETLRFLGLLFQSMLPEDIGIVRCVLPTDTGNYQLTPKQVACMVDWERMKLRINDLFYVPRVPFSFDAISAELLDTRLRTLSLAV
jgi:hypothetical protein